MSPEVFSILIATCYVLLAVAGVAWSVRRSGLPWQVWLLYIVERIYVPLMFGWRSNRRCPFPADGPALIVANHRSPVDPLMIWMNHHLAGPKRRMRTIHFLTAKEYFDVPGVGWITRSMQSIPVERNGHDLAPAREALKLLKRGEWVGIFPEGRINTGEGLLEADSGVAWLALRAQVPVYPVFIHDSPQGRTMVEPFRTPSRVRVTFGEPIDLSEYFGRRKSRELLREVAELMMRRLAETGGLAGPSRETLPFDASHRATG